MLNELLAYASGFITLNLTTIESRSDAGTSSVPTDFQKRVCVCAGAAADWLVRSIKVCGGNGSATFYSRFYQPLRGWWYPYPETTGYIIETLIAYARFAGRSELLDLAVRQADWIVSLQYDDGSLPGGSVVRGRREGPSVFNTGQMILGLVAASDLTKQAKYLESAARAARWLAAGVDPSSGTWTRHAYVSGHSPAYYTRVAWPMLEVHARTDEAVIRDAAVRVLDTIVSWQLPGAGFSNWGFKPGQAGFTHTIAYTTRGFLESARLLGEAGVGYGEAANRLADSLRRRMELRGRLAGAYGPDLRGIYWYTCLTGNCQMAIIWMKIYDQTGDARFLSAALKALQFVMDRQKMRSVDPNLRGAIAGSSPIWGRYLTLRYPNWAAKFYLDALMMAHDRIGELLEKGPCALQ